MGLYLPMDRLETYITSYSLMINKQHESIHVYIEFMIILMTWNKLLVTMIFLESYDHSLLYWLILILSNVCMQTGSGKTFTITGGAERYSDRGIIPRTLSYFYEQFEQVCTKKYGSALPVFAHTMFTCCNVFDIHLYNISFYIISPPQLYVATFCFVHCRSF